MAERVPVDPYGELGLSRSAWVSATVFLLTLTVYAIVPLSFFTDYYVGAETQGLAVFLGTVVLLIALQQLLTWRYILLRPELAVVEKHRKKKFALCGNAAGLEGPPPSLPLYRAP